MAAEVVPGTEGNDGLAEWLSKWGLQDHTQSLKAQGIKTPDDFKYIVSIKHFEKLMSRLGDISFMGACKLEAAWKSIVPNPQKTQAQIFFLGNEEKEILNTLNNRFVNISKDIHHIQKSFNSFNESIVVCKKNVNDSLDKIIVSINNKKNELLNKIDSIKQENEQLFQHKLNYLSKISKLCKENKERFEQIGSDNDITSENRSKQLLELLVMNITVDTDDDEKKTDSNNYYDIVGKQCAIPDEVLFVFNEDSFYNNLNTSLTLNCNNITTDWNFKPTTCTKVNVTKQFRYESDFDTNGIIYWIGTQKGNTDNWVNPNDTNDHLTVTSSSLHSGSLSKMIGRQQTNSYTKNNKNSWICIDFQNIEVKANMYTLRHGYSVGDAYLVNWNLEGMTKNESEWEIIKSHNQEDTLKCNERTHSWQLNCSKFYSKFRIRQFDKNYNNVPNHCLCLSGFEMYGDIIP